MYEMAQQLWAQGETVSLLVLLDTSCPTRLAYLARRVQQSRVGSLLFLAQLTLHHLRHLPQVGAGERLQYVTEKARSAPKRAQEVAHAYPEDATVRRRKQAERAYADHVYRYRPRPYPGRLTLFISEEAEHWPLVMGWRQLAAGGVVIHHLKGDHFSYLGSYAQVTAERLRRCLDEALTGAAQSP